MSKNYTDYDAEDPLNENRIEFTEKTVRMNFMKKVYGILQVQLTVTLAIIALFVYSDNVREYVAAHPGLWWVSMITMLVTMVILTCCSEIRRTAPTNYIFLGLFTLAEGFLLGCASVIFKSQEVMLAIAMCTVVVLGLTLYAFQTKIDFTMRGGILFAATLILLLFGVTLFFWSSPIASLIYSCLGALLFSVYIVYDTQIMMGGSHRYAISPEEYIFAALNLYVDITNLFLYILSSFGGRD